MPTKKVPSANDLYAAMFGGRPLSADPDESMNAEDKNKFKAVHVSPPVSKPSTLPPEAHVPPAAESMEPEPTKVIPKAPEKEKKKKGDKKDRIHQSFYLTPIVSTAIDLRFAAMKASGTPMEKSEIVEEALRTYLEPELSSDTLRMLKNGIVR